MANDALPFKSLYLAALDLSPAERTVFLDRECGSDPDRKIRLSEMLAAFDAAASSPIQLQTETNTVSSTATQRKPAPSPFVRNRKDLILGFSCICILLGSGVIAVWSWQSYGMEKKKYHDMIDGHIAIKNKQRQEFINDMNMWETKTYQFVTEYNANLFATNNGVSWFPAPKEQLDYLQRHVLWLAPEKNWKSHDPHFQSRVATGYYAAWYSGIGDGYFRIKEYGKTIDYLTKSLKYSELSFGKVDPMTLSIRTKLALTHHLFKQDDVAYQLIQTGDQYCRDAVEADPTLLDNRLEKSIISSWGSLIALAVVLPGDSVEKTSEEELWNRRIAICLAHPNQIMTNFLPQYDNGYSDFFSLYIVMKVDRADDVERVLRKQLAHLDVASKQKPDVWNDREKITIELAKHLGKTRDGRQQEAEDLLLIAIQELKPLWNGKAKEILTYKDNAEMALFARKYYVNPWDNLYGEAIRSLIDLYDSQGKSSKSALWKSEYEDYYRKMKTRYPNVQLPQ